MSAAVAVGTGIVPVAVIVVVRDAVAAAVVAEVAEGIDTVVVAARVYIADIDAAALEDIDAAAALGDIDVAGPVDIDTAGPVDARLVAVVSRLDASVSLSAEEEAVLRRPAS